MPNHCEMDFEVSGAPETVAEFAKKHVKNGTLDCDSVIPYPADLKEMDRDLDNPAGV